MAFPVHRHHGALYGGDELCDPELGTGRARVYLDRLQGRGESELEDSNCITLPYVIEKKDAWRGILVWLHKPEVMTVGTIAHEADHVANAIFKACGQGLDTGDDEMHSYLVGWAAECIDEVLQKALKSNG